MQQIAFIMKRKNGDGCVAAMLGQILKAAGYRTACLVGNGTEREQLLISGKPVSKKLWESLGEEPDHVSGEAKVNLLAQKEPEILFWIGQNEKELPKAEQTWILLREEQGEVQLGKLRYGAGRQWFDFLEPQPSLKNVELNMVGDWQTENAAAAIALSYGICREILEIHITEKHIRKGLMDTNCPGCLERLKTIPPIWTDRAADPQAAKALKSSVKRLAGERPVIGILGMERKEDSEEFLKEFCPLTQILFTMAAENGYRAYELAEMAREYQPNVTAVDSPEEALEIARLFAGEGQTKGKEMPLLLLVCPRKTQEKLRKAISDWKTPHSWQHQRL